ncbi:MAG: type II toxin-antitoxin system RelE/ParE family toxin [Candidatus Thermoplasmatota archaeon]
MFEVFIHKKFAKKLKEIEKPFLERIANFLDTLKEEPVPWRKFDIKKIEGEKNTYRVRIGKYRLIYFVDKNNKMIHILKIETREKVYK